jgi:hypothetical protein
MRAFRAIRASASNSTMLWTLWTWCQHCRSMTCFSVKMVPNLNWFELCHGKNFEVKGASKTESFWLQLLDTQNICVICWWNDIGCAWRWDIWDHLGHWGFLSVYILQSSICSHLFRGFSWIFHQNNPTIGANRCKSPPSTSVPDLPEPHKRHPRHRSTCYTMLQCDAIILTWIFSTSIAMIRYVLFLYSTNYLLP